MFSFCLQKHLQLNQPDPIYTKLVKFINDSNILTNLTIPPHWFTSIFIPTQNDNSKECITTSEPYTPSNSSQKSFFETLQKNEKHTFIMKNVDFEGLMTSDVSYSFTHCSCVLERGFTCDTLRKH